MKQIWNNGVFIVKKVKVAQGGKVLVFFPINKKYLPKRNRVVFFQNHVLFVCFGDVWCVLMFFFKNFHESSWNLMCFCAIFRYFFMKFQVCWCFLFDFPWFVMFFNALSTFSRIYMFCHVFFFRNSREISIPWISKDLYAFYVLFMFFTKRILAKT